MLKTLKLIFLLLQLIQRPDFYCPRYVKELKKVFKSGEIRKILRKNKKIFNYVTKSTGKNMTNLHEVFRIYQNLRSKVSCRYRIQPKNAHEIVLLCLGILKYENTIVGKKNISRASPHYRFLSVPF